MVDLLGYVAGFIAMLTFLPQVIKTIKLKHANDISLGMLYLTLTSNVLYQTYAFILELTPVFVMLSIMNIIVIIQLYLTYKYQNKEKKSS